MSAIDLYRTNLPTASRPSRGVSRELRRLNEESQLRLARGQLAVDRQRQLASQVVDDIAFLGMKEALYASALPHIAHRLAAVNDQIAMNLIEIVRGS